MATGTQQGHRLGYHFEQVSSPEQGHRLGYLCIDHYVTQGGGGAAVLGACTALEQSVCNFWPVSVIKIVTLVR